MTRRKVTTKAFIRTHVGSKRTRDPVKNPKHEHTKEHDQVEISRKRHIEHHGNWRQQHVNETSMGWIRKLAEQKIKETVAENDLNRSLDISDWRAKEWARGS